MSLNFPLLLVIAVAVCGVLALYDRLFLAPRRRVAIAQYQQSVGEPEPEVLEQLMREPLLVEYGKSFFPVLLLVLALRSFLVEPFQIPSGSMRPTLEVGDFILVSKFSYGIRLPVIDQKILNIGSPKRGDVMVFRYPTDPSVNYIKRVVGVPGDKIRYTHDKHLFINGELIQEKFLGEMQEQDQQSGLLVTRMIYEEQLGGVKHLTYKTADRNFNPEDRDWIVPEGHYFMMGDNRDDSNDSRFWVDPSIPPNMLGMVPDENIVGKAFAVWFSWPSPKLDNWPTFSRDGIIR